MNLPWLPTASGIYEAPCGIVVAGTCKVTSSNTVPLTQVNQFVEVEPRRETRTPSLTLVDMSFQKVVRRELRTVEPVFEGRPDERGDGQSRNSTSDPAYGLAANIARASHKLRQLPIALRAILFSY
jgi:hypothetical protein